MNLLALVTNLKELHIPQVFPIVWADFRFKLDKEFLSFPHLRNKIQMHLVLKFCTMKFSNKNLF